MDQTFGGATSSAGSAPARCEGEASSESDVAACEVDSASDEVERAFDATHSAVALNRAQTAGDNETRNGCNEVPHVLGNVGANSSKDSKFTTAQLSHGGLLRGR